MSLSNPDTLATQERVHDCEGYIEVVLNNLYETLRPNIDPRFLTPQIEGYSKRIFNYMREIQACVTQGYLTRSQIFKLFVNVYYAQHTQYAEGPFDHSFDQDPNAVGKVGEHAIVLFALAFGFKNEVAHLPLAYTLHGKYPKKASDLSGAMLTVRGVDTNQDDLSLAITQLNILTDMSNHFFVFKDNETRVVLHY